MTLYQFNALDDNAKAEYVWQHCNHIGKVIWEDSILMLYGSRGEQNFFIEMELQEDKIIKIRSFIKGIDLDKYVTQIDLLKMLNE
jgi:hypothetical protein